MDSSTAPIPINYLQMVFSNWEIIGTFMHSQRAYLPLLS
jgi:alcohol dehydrogenase